MKTTILNNGDILKTHGFNADIRHRQLIHSHIYFNNLIDSEKEFIDTKYYDEDIENLKKTLKIF